MATSPQITNPALVPLGAYKQFGLYGPVYQVISELEAHDGKRMIMIELVQTGEQVALPLDAIEDSIDAL